MSIFSKNPDDFFMNMKKLPKDLFHIVSLYVPFIAKLPLNKEFYKKYHHLFRDYVNKRKMENYIRKTVITDSDFVFERLLVENHKKWLSMNKYLYQECVYANYLIFLDMFCFEHKSVKCRKLIENLFQELGLSKNQHKKNLIRNIKWNH